MPIGAIRAATIGSPGSTAPGSCGNGFDAIPITSPGTSGRATRPGGVIRARPPIDGGCIFAEQPTIAAPDATIIWGAAFDPTTLQVAAVPAVECDNADALDPGELSGWMTIVAERDGREHVVLSDGWRRIRLDVDAGSLAAGAPVVLRYDIVGLVSAQAKVLPLQRFLYLCRHHRFARTLFEPDLGIPRSILLLRVYDAERAGASQREIAQVLFGSDTNRDWRGAGNSWRSRVKRLAREARAMAAGGYRTLMRARAP